MGRNPDSVEVSNYYCPLETQLIARARQEGIDRVIFVMGALRDDTASEQLDELTTPMQRHEAQLLREVLFDSR